MEELNDIIRLVNRGDGKRFLIKSRANRPDARKLDIPNQNSSPNKGRVKNTD